MSNVKWFLVVVAVALTSAAVPIAQGTSDSIPSRLTAVERKVTTLRRDLTTTQRMVTLLQGCITAAPVTAYGGNETEGYLYRNTAESREFLTSALDFTEQGDQPTAIMATIKPECVTRALSGAGMPVKNRRAGARAIPTLRMRALGR